MKNNRKAIIIAASTISGIVIIIIGFVFCKRMGILGNNPEGQNVIIGVNMKNGKSKEIYRSDSSDSVNNFDPEDPGITVEEVRLPDSDDSTAIEDVCTWTPYADFHFESVEEADGYVLYKEDDGEIVQLTEISSDGEEMIHIYYTEKGIENNTTYKEFRIRAYKQFGDERVYSDYWKVGFVLE